MQRALADASDAAGWPALALCLADGRPFGAAPYRPLRDRRNGIARLLVDAAEAWAGQRPGIAAEAARLATPPPAPAAGAPPGELHAAAAEAHAMAQADTLNGGFGPPPRHPSPALLGFLLARAARPDAPLPLIQQVERTCAALAAGAIHDHLGGGFFRACADAAWHQPFAEKRSRDSLHLALVLAQAAQTGLGGPSAPWRELALRATGWVLADCRRADGLIAHGLHADGPVGAGRWEEGAAYRWTRAQLDAVVGRDGGRILAARYGLDDEPRFPALRDHLAERDAARLGELVARWAVARRERPAHHRDGTAFAGDQGLALRACAACHALDPDGPWRAAASDLWANLGAAAAAPPAWREEDGAPAPAAAGARAIARLARGAAAAAALGLPGAGPRAAAWLDAALAVDGDDPADDEDGPAAAAELATACLALHRQDEAGRLLARHAAAMRRAPLTCAGLWAAREGWAALHAGR